MRWKMEVFVIVHAAPGGPRRRHVREVIDLSSLFLPSLQLFPSKTIEVTVRIHTMAAARRPLIGTQSIV